MRLNERDKRALIILAAVAVVVIGWWLGSGGDKPIAVVNAVEDIPSAERRLSKLRQIVAAVPGREQALSQVKGELAGRERGLIQADTAAQAQAQMLQILVRLGRKENPPIDMRNTEIGQVKALGDNYGEVTVAANFDTGIEQLLNLLASITAQKELIATSELRVGTAHPKAKTVPVRLTVSGVVRRELVPDKKTQGSL